LGFFPQHLNQKVETSKKLTFFSKKGTFFLLFAVFLLRREKGENRKKLKLRGLRTRKKKKFLSFNQKVKKSPFIKKVIRGGDNFFLNLIKKQVEKR
jgi:hypothetical protein